jgi:hypothetical protein
MAKTDVDIARQHLLENTDSIKRGPDSTPASEGKPAKKTKHKPAEHSTQVVELRLRGRRESPLVIHAFAEKAKQEIRDKQQKAAKEAKAARNPEEEFLAARYVDAEGRECVPLTCLKKALISAAPAFDDLTKVALRQAFFVEGVGVTGPLVPLERLDGSPAIGRMREDAVTIGISTRALAYRPEYPEWQVHVRIEFNPRLVSEAQLLALVDQAGWGVGIGEGRPERSSALGWGRFERGSDGA